MMMEGSTGKPAGTLMWVCGLAGFAEGCQGTLYQADGLAGRGAHCGTVVGVVIPCYGERGGSVGPLHQTVGGAGLG